MTLCLHFLLSEDNHSTFLAGRGPRLVRCMECVHSAGQVSRAVVTMTVLLLLLLLLMLICCQELPLKSLGLIAPAVKREG